MYSIYLPTHQGSRGLSSLWKLLTILEMRARQAAAGWIFDERAEMEEDRQTRKQAGGQADWKTFEKCVPRKEWEGSLNHF